MDYGIEVKWRADVHKIETAVATAWLVVVMPARREHGMNFPMTSHVMYSTLN